MVDPLTTEIGPRQQSTVVLFHISCICTAFFRQPAKQLAQVRVTNAALSPRGLRHVFTRVKVTACFNLS